jgi:hypothetical protein
MPHASLHAPVLHNHRVIQSPASHFVSAIHTCTTIVYSACVQPCDSFLISIGRRTAVCRISSDTAARGDQLRQGCGDFEDICILIQPTFPRIFSFTSREWSSFFQCRCGNGMGSSLNLLFEVVVCLLSQPWMNASPSSD